MINVRYVYLVVVINALLIIDVPNIVNGLMLLCLSTGMSDITSL